MDISYRTQFFQQNKSSMRYYTHSRTYIHVDIHIIYCDRNGLPRFVKKACLKRKALIVTQHQLYSRKQRSKQQHGVGGGGGDPELYNYKLVLKYVLVSFFITKNRQH